MKQVLAVRVGAKKAVGHIVSKKWGPTGISCALERCFVCGKNSLLRSAINPHFTNKLLASAPKRHCNTSNFALNSCLFVSARKDVMLMVRGRSFCLHALLGVLLPTTLVHSQLHQKRLTSPTCVNNREHSTILFSHARCGAMFMELRSVSAWPICNTWYRPFLRAGTLVGCFS